MLSPSNSHSGPLDIVVTVFSFLSILSVSACFIPKSSLIVSTQHPPRSTTTTLYEMPPLPGRDLGVRWHSTTESKTKGLILEVFVDFNCPFSKRLFERLSKEVKPHYGDDLELIFQPMPQPWHPSSCVMHECFHAASMACTSKDEDVFSLTFENAYTKFNDVSTIDMTRAQMHSAMCDIYGDKVEKKAFLDNLALDTSDGMVNGGNKATRLVKFYTKLNRQIGIHVTPTIRVNGIVCDSSSGWTLEQWTEFLDPVMQQPGL